MTGSIRCELFGHAWEYQWNSENPYESTDGVWLIHLYYCSRCNTHEKVYEPRERVIEREQGYQEWCGPTVFRGHNSDTQFQAPRPRRFAKGGADPLSDNTKARVAQAGRNYEACGECRVFPEQAVEINRRFPPRNRDYAEISKEVDEWTREHGGAPEDDAEAVERYRKAAEQGDAKAQNNLGAMYGKGKGVPQDDAEAVKWFRLAAEQGLAAAKRNLEVLVKKKLKK
jgi:hypothetical protein